ncbi:MAG: hypothetical protein KDD64_03515 [Bdellovibrionales bacterium]|nr:hypothetical protein [Bdellovibrionales bacterium]
MLDLGIWKLCLDGAMVLSLGYLGMKVIRTSGISEANLEHLRELDSSLKRLLKEADRSAADLAQNLTKQRTALEELLFDVETVENRLNKAIDEAQTSRKQLVTGIARAKETRDHDSIAPQMGVEEMAPASSKNYLYDLVDEPFSIADTEPASFGSPAAATLAPPKHPSRPVQKLQSPQSVNVFGEPVSPTIESSPAPIAKAPRLHGAQPAPLRQSIIKEVVEEPLVSSGGIEDVYAAAEELLATGKSLEQVATLTRLPVEEVRMLAQVIERDDDDTVSHVSSDDARLGVLSKGIRRERQVL